MDAVVRVVEAYPGTPLYSLAYPTGDHSMPWGLFWNLYAALPMVISHRELLAARAQDLGQRLAWGTKGAAAEYQRLKTFGFPNE